MNKITWLTRYLLLLIVFIITGSNVLAQRETGDSLLFKKYYDTAITLQLKADYKKAKSYYIKAINSAASASDKSNALNRLSYLYLETGNPDSCKIYMMQSWKIKEPLDREADFRRNFTKGVYSVYTNENIDEAIALLFKGLKYLEEEKDTAKILSLNLHICNAFTVSEQWQLLEKHAVKALHIAQKSGYAHQEIGILNALGVAKMRTEKLTEAEEIFRRVISLSDSLQLPHFKSSPLQNLIFVLDKQGKDEQQILEYSFELLDFYEKTNNRTGMSGMYISIGSTFARREKYGEAISYYEKALKLAEELNNKDGLQIVHSNLALSYAHIKKYEKAYYHQKKATEIKNEIVNEERVRQISEMEAKYEAEKKNKKITEQTLAIAQKDKSISQRNMWIVFSVSISVFVIVLIYMLYKRKHTRIKKEEEQKINSAIFESEQKERIRIARDLHDSIGQKLSVIKMLLSSVEDSEEKQKISTFLDEAAREVRSISHNMVPEILNFGLIKALDNMADRINSTEHIKVNVIAGVTAQKSFLPKETELSVYRIVQEILANIIRHAHTDKIKIEIKQESGQLSVHIRDNGIGFDVNTIDQSEGLGWKNIFARIKLINGELKILSEKQKGSDFVIKIPKI